MNQRGMRIAAVVMVGVLLLAGLAWGNRRRLKHAFGPSRIEHSTGILVRLEVPPPSNTTDTPSLEPGTYCILVHDYAPTSGSVRAQLEERFRHSDGLETAFCDDSPELLNRRIRIAGFRVASEVLGQDCNNRSCFDWVVLKRE